MKKYFFFLLIAAVSCSSKTHDVKSYYDHDGKMLKEEYSVLTDSPSVREGKYFLYSQFGKLIETRNYSHNQMTDTLRRFYESGKLSEESIYKNNQLNGYRKLFYENGKLMLEEFYQNGDSIGEWKKF